MKIKFETGLYRGLKYGKYTIPINEYCRRSEMYSEKTLKKLGEKAIWDLDEIWGEFIDRIEIDIITPITNDLCDSMRMRYER